MRTAPEFQAAGGGPMRKLDEIVLWACIGVIAVLAFLGGLLTAVFTVWIFLFNGGA